MYVKSLGEGGSREFHSLTHTECAFPRRRTSDSRAWRGTTQRSAEGLQAQQACRAEERRAERPSKMFKAARGWKVEPGVYRMTSSEVLINMLGRLPKPSEFESRVF